MLIRSLVNPAGWSNFRVISRIQALVGVERVGRITSVVVPTILVVVVGMIFAAGALTSLFPARYVMAWLLVLASLLLILLRPHSRVTAVLLVMIPAWAAIVSVYCALFSTFQPSDNDALFRYVLLFPVGGVFGYLLAGSSTRVWLARSIVGWAIPYAGLAVVEIVSGTHLFPRANLGETLVRDGFIRAVVTAEHPLVLSALLLAAIPFLWAMRPRLLVSIPLTVLMLAGIVATGSRGALALFVVLAVLALVIWRWPAAHPGRAWLRIGVALAVVAVVIVALIGSPLLHLDPMTSHDPETASLQYRLALYQKVLSSLTTNPWGWGIGGLPADTFLVRSPFGIHDLSVTVDSELVLLVFDAGVLGLAGFVVALAWLASRWVLASTPAVASLLILLAGFYLALHAWTGLPLLLAVLLGAALADSHRAPRPARKLDA